MSLAATLSASGMRPASFLPAIKCSNCGEEIEIARMGDHLCSNRSAPQRQNRPSPAALTNPYSSQQWNSQQYQPPPSPSSSTSQNWPSKLPATTFATSPLQHAYRPSESGVPSSGPVRSGSLPSTKLPMPPRINAELANSPFLAPSYPRSASPSSPVLSIRSARSGSSNGSRPPMLRNMTMPSPFRGRSPSPELASNLDCAFPSFPTSNSRPGSSNGRKTPTNSERAPSRGGFESHSPRSTGGESVMKRANTLKSGPFDAGRRKTSREENTSAALPASLAIATPVDRQPGSDRLPLRKASLARDGPAFKNSFSDEPLEDFTSNIPAPLRLAERSNTFPLHPGNVHEQPRLPALARTPSEPMAGGRERRPSVAASITSNYSRVGPVDEFVRPQSRDGPRIDPRLQDAPPVPRPVQQYRQPSKHAPSDSASSVSSTSQTYSNTNSSEGPSPISSAASSIDAFSPISQASAYEERPKSIGRLAGYSTRSQQQNPGLRAEQPAARAPPPNFARPRPHGAGQVQSMDDLVESPMESRSEGLSRIASRSPPADLAMVKSQSPPADLSRTASRSPPGHMSRTVSTSPPADFWDQNLDPHANEHDPYKPSSPNPAGRSRSKSTASQYSLYQPDPISSMPPPPMPAEPTAQYLPYQTSPVSSMPPPPVPAEPVVRPLQRRNTSAKAVCRGCNLAIEGKSVKAADGRLTGRWHKHCFTCRTCAQPFATADFYVINNEPYCKQHYHEKNGSVCAGCQRGIEGQYLETSSHGVPGALDRKFHPTCFTCTECRLILSSDYFEIRGQPYCERHAHTASRGQSRGPGGAYNGRAGPGGLQPPGRRGFPERRTTKLMMM